MDFQFRLHQIRVSGSNIALKKILRKLTLRLQSAQRFAKTQKLATTLADPEPAGLRRLIDTSALHGLLPHKAELLAAAQHYCKGEFPVGGRGWIPVLHESPVQGMGGFRYTQEAFPYPLDAEGEFIAYLVNEKNIPESQRRWRLIQQPHSPIDWQRDMRSGYTWSEGLWADMISLGNGKGVDPKGPWDLGRLHALLHLSAAYCLADDVSQQAEYLHCFRSLFLDFVSLNPPGFGIQWKSPMDVAIRLANMLVAYDILCIRSEPDVEFAKVFRSSVHEHARYVVQHLEWSDGMRANHYLANLAGLGAAAAYLEDCSLRRQLIELLDEALARETLYQFLPDGGNFEASLPYHRLSAEMLVWSWVFAEQCPELESRMFAPDVQKALARIADFSLNTSSSAFCIPQIGDNDSGRFLAFLPFHWQVEHSDRPLNIYHLVQSFAALSQQAQDPLDSPEFSIIRSLLARGRDQKQVQGSQPLPIAERAATHYAAPDFGLWRWTKARYELFLRAGSIGQNGKGGHAHNDQLSICVFVDGLELICDPGTYVYTALPEQRNTFRSTALHNCLQVEGEEQELWSSGNSETLFWLSSNKAQAEVLQCNEHIVRAQHHGFNKPCIRELKFHEAKVCVVDEFAGLEKKVVRYHLRPECRITRVHEHLIRIERQGRVLELSCNDEPVELEQSVYSPEYGAVLATHCVLIRTQRQTIECCLSVVNA